MMAKKGIDLSYANPKVDFAKAKAAGVEFAIIRTGYRCKTDDMFYSHIKGAADAKMDVGVYCYCMAATPAEARKEADYVLNLIKDCSLTYPIFYDMEDPSIENLSRTKLTNIAVAFLEKIKAAGYTAGIYANPAWLENRLNKEKLKGYDIWLAHWTGSPDKPSKYAYGQTMWQWGAGNVSGISGKVDCDICYVDYPSQAVKTTQTKTEKRKSTDFLNFRRKPSLKAEALGVIAPDTAVTVYPDETTTADGYVWIKTLFNGLTGYVAEKYLTKA